MSTTKRIFLSFAIEDEWARIYLGGQAKSKRTPFEFVDMSVKEPFDEKWKTNCRTRIKGCDGVIVLVGINTYRAEGVLWEIQCAIDEGITMIGMYIKKGEVSYVPKQLYGHIMDWTWDGIADFIDSL